MLSSILFALGHYLITYWSWEEIVKNYAKHRTNFEKYLFIVYENTSAHAGTNTRPTSMKTPVHMHAQTHAQIITFYYIK